LKHFAAYGLRAAEDAAERAAAAHHAGAREDLLHWLEVCRTLDPGRASRLHRRLGRHA
jgi:hypothetical protein